MLMWTFKIRTISFLFIICCLHIIVATSTSSSSSHLVPKNGNNNIIKANNNVVEQEESSKYLSALLAAQCKAICLAQNGESVPSLDRVSLLLTNPATCLHSSCKRCQECISSNKDKSSVTDCRHEFNLPTHCITSNSNYKPQSSLSSSSSITYNNNTHRLLIDNVNHETLLSWSNFSSPNPLLHCSQEFHNENDEPIFNVNFRFEYEINHSQVLDNFSNWDSQLIPRIFVIKKQINENVEFIISENWLNGFIIPTNTESTIVVTAVSPTTAYRPSISERIHLHNSFDTYKRGRPKDLKVIEVRPARGSRALRRGNVNNNYDEENDDEILDEDEDPMELQVLLHWKSGSGLNATCQYGIYFLHEAMEKKEIKTPEEAFWFVIDKKMARTDITFETEFEVEVHELPGENSLNQKIKLPSCLEFLHGDFTLCAPPPVTNLKAKLHHNGLLTIDWSSPTYTNTSTSNQIHSYYIDAIRVVPILLHLSPTIMTSLFGRVIRVPGNVTHIEKYINMSTVEGNGGAGAIKITVTAKAYKRTSRPASITIPQPILVQTSSLYEKLWTTIGTILSLIVLIFGSFGIKICFEKRQRKKQNREYFETLSLNGGEIPHVADLTELELGTRSEKLYNYSSKWEIDTSCLKLGEVIGAGAFGCVRKAELYLNDEVKLVAVKTLKSPFAENLLESNKFWEEFEILKGLGSHQHVVGLIGIISSYGPPSLIVEYCHGGDLQSHLRKYCKYRPTIPLQTDEDFNNDHDVENQDSEAKPSNNGFVITNEIYFMGQDHNKFEETDEPIYYLSDLDILSYARQIACGMEFLSTNKIVHRDLAARNVLVGSSSHCNNDYDLISNRTLKIADFGLSRDVYEQNWYKKTTNGLIPIKWLALECLLQEVYTSKSDVWSFGILLWEIVTFGGSPYPGVENINIFDLLKTGYRMPKPENCTDLLYSVMRCCWNEDPHDRPEFSTIKSQLDSIMESSASLDYLCLNRGHSTATVRVVDDDDNDDEMDVALGETETAANDNNISNDNNTDNNKNDGRESNNCSSSNNAITIHNVTYGTNINIE